MKTANRTLAPLALLLATLPACTTARAGPSASFTMPDTVSFTMSQFGEPFTQWSLAADGSGTWSETSMGDGTPDSRVTTSAMLPANAAAAAQMAQALARLPAREPEVTRCREWLHDAPAGTLTLARDGVSQDYQFALGCRDAANLRYTEHVLAPNALVAARGRAATPAWSSVTFTMRSWGQPVTEWTVNADGSGTWSRSEPREGGSFQDRVTTSATLPADAAAAAELAARLAALPGNPPTTDGCKTRITDQPYGALTVTYATGPKEYRYDAGCLDAAYQRFMGTLRAANEQVAGRGRAAAAQ